MPHFNRTVLMQLTGPTCMARITCLHVAVVLYTVVRDRTFHIGRVRAVIACQQGIFASRIQDVEFVRKCAAHRS